MATQPDIAPNRIDPQAPPERPSETPPAETPCEEPPEVAPSLPDQDFPDPGLPEVPSLPD